MENIYTNGEYFKKNPTCDIIDSPFKATNVLELISKHKLLVKSVCEVGCGAGEILKILQVSLPENTKLYGYDISPNAIEIAKEKANENLQFYCENFMDKNILDLDLILCLDVFEHVDDYIGFLRLLKNKSKYQIFNIPLDISALTVAKLKPIMYAREKTGHLHHFIKDTALETLEYAGYQIIDWKYAYDKNSPRAATPLQKIVRLACDIMFPICPDFTARLFGTYSLVVLAIPI